MKLSDFQYDLPDELIAKCPGENRDSSRLLILHKESGSLEHKDFPDILDYFESGDLLVLNNSKVFPARLIGEKDGGGQAEILLNQEVRDGTWEVIGKRLKAGKSITFTDSRLKAEIIEKSDETYLAEFNLSGKDFFAELDKIGQIPLPPYIKKRREVEGFAYSFDKERYQTVYAKKTGSSAAPTAGLHFTPDLLAKLRKKGVIIKELTLHVGLGTFLPVKVDDPTKHRMHKEHFILPKETLEEILKAKKDGRRVIAVGTTTTRVLEHVFKEFNFSLDKINITGDIVGATEIFIFPGFNFRCIDGMVTNFHLSESTLLLLVSAFAGKDKILKAYDEAIKEKYRFFSYGDAMLIL